MPGLLRFGLVARSARRKAAEDEQTQSRDQRGATDMLPDSNHHSARLFQQHSQQPASMLQHIGTMVRHFKRIGSKQIRAELLALLRQLFGKEFKSFDDVGSFLRDRINQGNSNGITHDLSVVVKNISRHGSNNSELLKALKEHTNPRPHENSQSLNLENNPSRTPRPTPFK